MIRWICTPVALFLVFPMAASAEETSGTVRAVHADKSQIDVKGIVSDSIYDLNKDAKVCLDGKKASLKDLQPNDKVHIVYKKNGDRMQASEVRGLRIATETKGTVHKVDASGGNLILKGVVSDTTYHLDNGAKIWINDKEGHLSDIREGDEVRITYEHTRRPENPLALEVCVMRK